MGLKYRDPKTGQFKEISVKTSDTLPIGAVVSYAGLNAPTGWLICDGRAISRTIYANLFTIIGTQYGAGDGSTTFNIPNLKGKVVVGLDGNDTDFDTIGKTSGEKKHTLTVEEMPSHSHILYSNKDYQSSPGAGYWGWDLLDGWAYGGEQDVTNGGGTRNSGGSQSHNNLQPYQVQNYIIKAFQSAGIIAQVAQTKTTSSTDVYSCNYINEKLTSEPKITVWTSSTPMITADNEEIRCMGNDGTVSSLLLSFLDTLTFTDSTKFSSSIVFKTSSNGCSFAITPPTSVSFKMAGDDVIDGNFSPQPNKVYDIIFYWNGFYLNGIVKGTKEKTYEITIENGGVDSSYESFNIYTKEDASDLATIEYSNSKKLTLTQNYLYIEWRAGLMDRCKENLNCEIESVTNRTDSSGNTYWRYKVIITESPAYVQFYCWQDGPIK